MKHISRSLKETQKIAEDFIAELLYGGNAFVASSVASVATVVGLYGELGAGKTTFTQTLSRTLGVRERVLSPTFVIMKSYLLSHKSYFYLIHIDAYRMESADELVHLGWQELISNPKNLILIEWPEKIADIMPEHIKINLSHISENVRGIEII